MTTPPTTLTPRIAPLEPPYTPELAEMLRRWMPPGAEAEPLALFRTLAVHDGLFSRMRPLGAGILGHGRVPARDREIVIHRTCARAGATYEWGVHAVAFAAAVGLSQDQIRATAVGAGDDPAWSDDDAALIALVDELHDGCAISDATWNSLSRRYQQDQLLELVIIAGWYRLLACVINVARVQPEPWAAPFPVRD
jgi:alkylhydroperoxidase family enzyme